MPSVMARVRPDTREATRGPGQSSAIPRAAHTILRIRQRITKRLEVIRDPVISITRIFAFHPVDFYQRRAIGSRHRVSILFRIIHFVER